MTTVLNTALTSDGVAGTGAFTSLERIEGAAISDTGEPFGSVQVTLQPAAASGNLVLTSMWIGHAADVGDFYDFNGDQVQLLFGGAAGVTLVAGGAQIVSDVVNFPLDPHRALIIAYDGPSGSARNVRRLTPAGGNYTVYFKSSGGGSDAATTNKTSYSSAGAILDIITKIDAFAYTPTLLPDELSPTDKSATISLSEGNRRGDTSTGGNQGVRSIHGKRAGKYYIECDCTVLTGADSGFGICTAAASLTGLGNNAALGVVYFKGGSVWFNGSSVGSTGVTLNGTVAAIALDLDNAKVHVRVSGGQWFNASNPATNTGGIDISAIFTIGGTTDIFPVMLLSASGEHELFNFGQKGPHYPPPAGFIVGWPQPSIDLTAAFVDDSTMTANIDIANPVSLTADFVDDSTMTADISIANPVTLTADFVDDSTMTATIFVTMLNALSAAFSEDSSMTANIQIAEPPPPIPSCIVTISA
jgi:hypothetical protein